MAEKKPSFGERIVQIEEVVRSLDNAVTILRDEVAAMQAAEKRFAERKTQRARP